MIGENIWEKSFSQLVEHLHGEELDLMVLTYRLPARPGREGK